MLDLRVPRTLLGIAAGASLGLAGALMQSLTRNPLADPGLLGINAGAAAAVVIAIGLLGLTGTTAYVWFAFLGAGVAAVAVYSSAPRAAAARRPCGSRWRAPRSARRSPRSSTASCSPTRCCCRSTTCGRSAGWAAAAGPNSGRRALHGPGRGWPRCCSRGRSTRWRMGEDSARALGAHVGAHADRRRGGDHAAVRRRDGRRRPDLLPRPDRAARRPRDLRPDRRWVLAYSAVLGAVAPAGRPMSSAGCSSRPQELQAGLMLAFVGAPLFIAIVRRRSIPAL